MSSKRPQIIILAGPNGAGKTTFAREYLPLEGQCLTFINADLIAEGLSPLAPSKSAIRAGRLMLQLIDECASRRQDFAFETTLAGKNYAKSIRSWRAADFDVVLYFLSLHSADQAIERVALRVAQGGHDIPQDVIRRRFALGLTNFETLYKPLVSAWFLYDNSGSSPVCIDGFDGRESR